MKTMTTSIKVTDNSGAIRAIPVQVQYSSEVIDPTSGEVMKVADYTQDPDLQFIIRFNSGKVQYSSRVPIETVPSPELA